jgi:hypothetical protein
MYSNDNTSLCFQQDKDNIRKYLMIQTYFPRFIPLTIIPSIYVLAHGTHPETTHTDPFGFRSGTVTSTSLYHQGVHSQHHHFYTNHEVLVEQQ